jgi:hypothetical protein
VFAVAARIRLADLQLACDAQDPQVVPLIEALATQPDEQPETPVREGAPTFERFLAEIRSPQFRKKSAEEQSHYRIEMLKALEAPDAEVPLSDRLRLHEILLRLWQDDSLFARRCLLDAIAVVRLTYGPWRALKRIFKEAEARGDTEVYGALAARFDRAHAAGDNDVSRATLAYLVRRAWRYLRRTAVRLPAAYADVAADFLAPYTVLTNWQGTWVANHIFYHESGAYGRTHFNFRTLPSDLLAQRAFADLWRRSPRPLFSLLERARSDRVRAFAVAALKADFRAVLREVDAAWVARLVAVGSGEVDDLVVWVLANVPRFEQAAFRSLGLHEAVLRLLESPSRSARSYAAGYARAHARDLPVSDLVRLADNDSEEVRKLVVDLLKERDPRRDIGLDAWGWLLETRHGNKLAADTLRQHFGARELTPAWFKARLFSTAVKAFQFARDFLPQVHPYQRLGPGFFTDVIDSIADWQAALATDVAQFALQALAGFDVNALDIEFLQRLLLHPLTTTGAEQWINEGRLKASTLPLTFWKSLAFHPDWEANAWLTALRQSGPPWARGMEFDEGRADRVLAWLGDVRRFTPADLGFDWLMRLVDRTEPRYHDFAVEVLSKAFRPADFAPAQPAAAPAAPAAAAELGGASFLFTGKMATMQRKEAETKVKEAGGSVASSVTKKLHYLVIGDEGSPLYSGGRKGDKQIKAEQLNAAGANIRIISETAFLRMLAGGPPPEVGAGATLAGCERLWEMAVAPGAAAARRGQFARLYILRHHPEIGPAQTDRPIDPGAEVPVDFLSFQRVQPLFAETRKPLRDFAVELARWEFARWKPSAEALLTLAELPHGDVRSFVAEALVAEDTPEKRKFRIDPEGFAPDAVYRFCESPDAEVRRLGMQMIRRSPRLQVPEEMFRLTESPDRLVRGFVIRSLWQVYRDRGVTADWKPAIPPASTLAKAMPPESRGPGVPHRPEKPPAGGPTLAEFLRRVLFEVPPGRPESQRSATASAAGEENAAGTAALRLKPLPARRAKLELVEVLRDQALEDAAFAAGVLPLLDEFMTSRGPSERAACLVAVTRIRHAHPALRTAVVEAAP